jgi:hypothetical protein
MRMSGNRMIKPELSLREWKSRVSARRRELADDLFDGLRLPRTRHFFGARRPRRMPSSAEPTAVAYLPN